MRIKKELKIKILNQRIKKLETFQLKSTQNLKKPEGARISKYQVKNLAIPLFSKEGLKFPLLIDSSPVFSGAKTDFIYFKDKNFHFKKDIRLSDPLFSFQKIVKLTSNNLFLQVLKK